MSSISRDWNVKIAPHVEVLVHVTLGPSAAVRSWLLAVRLNRFGQCLNPSAVTRGDQRRTGNGVGISTSLPEGQVNSFPKMPEKGIAGHPCHTISDEIYRQLASHSAS